MEPCTWCGSRNLSDLNWPFSWKNRKPIRPRVSVAENEGELRSPLRGHRAVGEDLRFDIARVPGVLLALRFDDDDAVGDVPHQRLVDHRDAVGRVRVEKAQQRARAEQDRQLRVDRCCGIGLVTRAHDLHFLRDFSLLLGDRERVRGREGNGNEHHDDARLDEHRLHREPVRQACGLLADDHPEGAGFLGRGNGLGGSWSCCRQIGHVVSFPGATGARRVTHTRP
jgi:hypothetical protein